MSRFQWADLITPDAAAAEAFAATLGWRVSEPLDAQSGYRVFATPEGPAAGLSTTERGAASHWLLQLRVDDLAQTLRRASFLQLDVLLTPEEGDPHTAILADPTGAVFAVTDATAPATSQLRGAALRCDRPDLGARVYKTLFGLRVGSAVRSEAGSVTPLLDAEGPVAWLIAPPKPPEHGQWLPIFPARAQGAAPAPEAATLTLGPLQVRRVRPAGAEALIHSPADTAIG